MLPLKDDIRFFNDLQILLVRPCGFKPHHLPLRYWLSQRSSVRTLMLVLVLSTRPTCRLA
jgi:hypothetical protein